MLFPDQDKANAKHSPQDEARAKLLRHAVIQSTRSRKVGAIKSWANVFRLMRTADKIDEKELDAVLKWYCRHIKSKFVPHAHSATSFRQKFAAIVKARERASEAPPALHVTEVSSAAQQIAASLYGLGWNVSLRSLAASVQHGIDELAAMRLRLVAIANDRQDDRERLKWLAGQVVAHVPSVLEYIRSWTVQTWHILTSEKYTTSIERQTFRINHPRFVRDMQSLASRLTGDAGRWDELYKEITHDHEN